MEYYFYKDSLRKTTSGLGFFVFTCIATMNLLAIIFVVPYYFYNDSLSNTGEFLLDAVLSLVSFLIVGLIYSKISGVSLGAMIPFKKVKLNLLVPLVLMGFGVAFLGDYITDIFNSNISIFGLKSSVDSDYTIYTPVEALLYILSVSVVPAIAEEFAFRGILLGRLRQYGDAFAIMVSAIMFGAMHSNVVQIPFAFVLGLVFGFIAVKTNSLLPTIIIHFLNNFFSVFMSMLSDNKFTGFNLTDNEMNMIYTISMLVIVVLGIISVLILSKNKNLFVIEDNDKMMTFKQKMISGLTSTGMIFAFIVILIETVMSTTISYG